MLDMTDPIQVQLLDGLRLLRLDHWLRTLELRKCADDIRRSSVAKENANHIKYYDKRANYHLSQVQLLNEFFPIGDTAEKDESEGLNL